MWTSEIMFRIITLAILINLTSVRGNTYDNAATLRTVLLTSYNPDVVPVNSQLDPLNINLTLYLRSIPDVDPLNGKLTLAVQIMAEWFDEKMVWNPTDYGGLDEIFITSADVWTPYLTIANPDQFDKIDQTWMPVQYKYDGHAYFFPGNVVHCSCAFYMKYWPFDKQVCPFIIFPFGYPVNKVLLNVPDVAINTEFYKKNPEWNLIEDSITYEIDNTYRESHAIYYIRLTRQPEFYMLTVIMPISGTAMLTCLVFLLPNESGERVGYSITMVLALAVFLTVTAADIPKTSDPIPILCVYILFSMMICMGGLIMVIWSLAIYHRSDKKPVTAWYKALVRITKCRRCKRNNVRDIKLTENDNTRSNARKTPKSSLNRVQVVQDLGPVDADEEDVSWVDVSQAVDRLVFFVLVMMTYIPTFIILIYIAAASKFVS